MGWDKLAGLRTAKSILGLGLLRWGKISREMKNTICNIKFAMLDVCEWEHGLRQVKTQFAKVNMSCEQKFATPDVCEWELGLRARHVSTQISSGGWSDPASGINTILGKASQNNFSASGINTIWTIGEGITRNPASGINWTIGPIVMGKASQKQNPASASGINTMEREEDCCWGRHHKNILRKQLQVPWEPLRRSWKRQHSLNNVLSCNWLCLVSSFEKYFFFRHFESCYETRVRV